ncbi:hypothetical protein FQI94_25280 [Escherichia coli]|uniref:Uncharacterized protein n=1 Tax=Escherichia coli TaxID=562 RepID=A0A244AB89_ECOLX|nr:hypothetical protein [Escherichia coli]EFN7271673.1 hypothetical protein [Escherichia coli O21]EEU9457374.1 hypothetical protein [Escherichia coli]EEU9481642.1 hypothetical protein [Escherichia coli]EEW2133828.1 hypothetical protein [Escherichia coli]
MGNNYRRGSFKRSSCYVNAKIIGRFGDADDFLDFFIMPAYIVGGTFQGCLHPAIILYAARYTL